jgi:hypothetical protein
MFFELNSAKSITQQVLMMMMVMMMMMMINILSHFSSRFKTQANRVFQSANCDLRSPLTSTPDLSSCTLTTKLNPTTLQPAINILSLRRQLRDLTSQVTHLTSLASMAGASQSHGSSSFGNLPPSSPSLFPLPLPPPFSVSESPFGR